jgi:hypothetical protein
MRFCRRARVPREPPITTKKNREKASRLGPAGGADEEQQMGKRRRTMGWVMIRWTLVDAMAAAPAGASPPWSV